MTSINKINDQSEKFVKTQKECNNLTKFIHASDIHIGSHQYRNEDRANDFINAFEQILTVAILHEVDFILLGGDVFNSLEMLPGLLTKVVTLLNNFKIETKNRILIVAIEGNHDIRKFSRGRRFENRGQSWLKLLSSLGLIVLLDADLDLPADKMFKEYNFKTTSGGKIRIKDAVIYGTRYLGQKPTESIFKIWKGIEKDDGFFHILLQHFGIEGQMEHIPGVDYLTIKALKDSVNYLALGHFHSQFILDDWIFNPGSSESTCSSDFSFKRGIFLVSITRNERYAKSIKKVQLTNRTSIWRNVYFKTEFKNKDKMYNYIIQKLRKTFNLSTNFNQTPVLFLILKGIKPFSKCKINKKELTQIICETLPVIDVRIYSKFSNILKTLDIFFITGK